MAGFSWSNPDQSDATAAKLQGSYRPEQVQIGSIVAALLKQKHDEEELRRQQTQDLIKGIGSAAVGYEKGQQLGAADDSANAALYGAQYPNDPYGGYSNPDKVPDYGGTDALKSAMLEKKLETDPYKQQYEKARLDAEQALAHNRWTYPANSGSGDNTMTPRQDMNTANDAQKAAGQYYEGFGLSDNALNDQNIHAPSDTPAVYSKGAPATTVPQGQLLIVDPKDGSYHYVTQDYLDQSRNARDSYQQAQQNYRSKLGVGNASGAAPPPNAQGSVGVRQGDVDQVRQQAIKILQDNGKPTTDANVEYVIQQMTH